MSNNYIKFIRSKNANEFGDDLFIEGEDDEFGFFSNPFAEGGALEILNPVSAIKTYSKKGVSQVFTEARTELADKDAPKDSLAAKIQRAAPSVVETVGITAETTPYLRAKDSGWKGPYAPEGGTLYYWDKNKKIIKYINPETGKLVTLTSKRKSYRSLANTTKLSWTPTSKSSFPTKSATKKKTPKAKVVRKSKAYDDQKKKSTAITPYTGEGDLDIGAGAGGAGFMGHLKDNWIAYTAGGVALVGLPLLFLAFGSKNKDWTVIMNGAPVGSISEFYEVNKVGNQHGVEPISDIDMTMIMALQPGEKHHINLGTGGVVIVERGAE